MADGLAELAVRWPAVPTVFCETRALAEEWTFRYLAAAHQWTSAEDAAAARIGVQVSGIEAAPVVDDASTAGPPADEHPSTAEVRAWARASGVRVSDRGRLPPHVWAAWHDAH